MRTGLVLMMTGLAVFFHAAGGQAADAPDRSSIPNVFIITLSGVDDRESIADPDKQYMPSMFGEISREGTLYTDLENVNFEFHMPSVDAIDMGKDFPCFSAFNSAPTIFQYYRKKYGVEQDKTWLIGHWFPAQAGSTQDDAVGGQATLPCQLSISIVSRWTVDDALTPLLTPGEKDFIAARERLADMGIFFFQWDSLGFIYDSLFNRIVETFHPKLVHYVMSDVESAHYDSYSRYVQALRRSDAAIRTLWRRIQEDPYYRDNTWLFVCPDHGRNGYYMAHTENPAEARSHVWLYVFGPGVKKGAVVERRVHHADIFATVAQILKLDVPKGDGRVLEECIGK